MLQKIIKSCIYLLVFLVPIFFLPFSVEALEFNKGYLLMFLTTIALLAWLAKMIFKDRKVCFQRTPLDIPVLVFLFFMLVSSFLSVDKIASLLGFYGRFWPNLIGILSLGIFYFLITNNVQFEEVQDRKARGPREADARKARQEAISHLSLIKVFLWSSFFATLIAYFSIFGVWRWLNQGLAGATPKLALPSFMLSRFFNAAAGSLQGLAVFLSIVFVFLLTLFACGQFSRKKKIFLGILLSSQVILLAILDFWQAWLIIFISLALFLAFSLWKRAFKENVNRLSLPVLFFIISLCFLAFNPWQDFLPPTALSNLPQEVLLSQGTSWKTGAASFLRHPVAGSGLGTFSYVFSKYKPESFLQSPFWALRFDRASSHMAEVLGTVGVLGILSYLFLLGWFLIIGWLILNTDVKQGNFSPGRPGLARLPLLMAFIALFVSQFLYYQNTTLAFTFWLFLGLGVLSWQKPVREKVWKFGDFPEMGLVVNSVFWVLLISFLVFYVISFKFYLADTFYKKQLLAPDRDLTYLEKAVRWAHQRVAYHIALANSYRALLNQEILKPTDEIDQQLLLTWAVGAINQSQIATQLSPRRVQAWETLGMVYRDIRGLAQGAPDWAAKAFEEALRYEPKNPALLTELGKLKMAQDEDEKARELFAEAIGVRGQYWQAELQIALLDEKAGEVQKATKKLENLKRRVPLSMDVHFQLGRLYYNQDELDKAISEFKQVIILFPNHSNAHFSLGLAYEKKGRRKSALREFEKVLELNPDNEEVKAKIKELRRGEEEEAEK